MTRTVAAPKGTKTTEVIIGSAAASLASGIKSMRAVVEEINKLDEKVEAGLIVLSDLEAKIIVKETELRNATAQNKIELGQEYEANKKGFVTQWLTENGFEMIPKEELEKIKAELAGAEKATSDAVTKQVSIVSSSMKSKHDSELREKELEFKAKEAQNNASITLKDEKISFLEQQVAAWKK